MGLPFYAARHAPADAPPPWPQFLYDMWYSYMTPDMEFPAEVRRALNSAFGNLAQHGRHVDLKAVLG